MPMLARRDEETIYNVISTTVRIVPSTGLRNKL